MKSALMVLLVSRTFCDSICHPSAFMFTNGITRAPFSKCWSNLWTPLDGNSAGVVNSPRYQNPGARRQSIFSIRSNSNNFQGDSNITDIFRSVGATGNLRFKKSGTNPVDSKRNEPNFKVKAKEEAGYFGSNNTASSSGATATQVENPVFNDGQKQARFENGEFVEDILDSIASIVKASRSDLKHSFRDNGKWRSITVEVPVESAAQLYDVYAAIGRDPRVKFKF